MSGRRRIAGDTLAEMLRLREECGWSYRRIGATLGISANAVYWHCLIHGADKPGAGPLPQTAPGPAVVSRGEHLVRRFRPDEDALIHALAMEGKSDTEIARATGRRPNSIRGRLATLARHEERREQPSFKAPDAAPDHERTGRPPQRGGRRQ